MEPMPVILGRAGVCADAVDERKSKVKRKRKPAPLEAKDAASAVLLRRHARMRNRREVPLRGPACKERRQEKAGPLRSG